MNLSEIDSSKIREEKYQKNKETEYCIEIQNKYFKWPTDMLKIINKASKKLIKSPRRKQEINFK